VPNDPKTDIYGTVAQESLLLREIIRRNRALPGVEEVAIGNMDSLPLGHGRDDFNMIPLIREGLESSGNRAPQIDSSTVTPEYFHLLGMTLLRGRLFTNEDVADTPLIAIVNEAAARAYWPGQEPVGKRIQMGSAKPAWATIAGVIANARTESLAEAGTPHVYLSAYQRHTNDLAIYLRGQLDPAAIPAQARSQIQSINAELPVFGAESLDDVLTSSLSVRRFSMELVATFAATALLLAGLGIYGTISYLVNEQTREIAIRLALGAQRGDILRMVLGQGLGMAAIGAGAGVAGALIVSHLMASLLYGVSPYDLTTFAGVTLVLTGVALAASYIPALRAMRLDPIKTLHSE
jgi:putative ABC transport system permease protein